jgi:hypothetical protein
MNELYLLVGEEKQNRSDDFTIAPACCCRTFDQAANPWMKP